ncbi:MAG: glycosyltransferase family 4 protein, partial [Microcystaceae cyanobacterium]
VEISNWVDVNFIHPQPKENNGFRQAHHLENKFVILYSGNIALTQPLETLIDAAAQLTHIPDIAVVIVGKQDALERLKIYSEEQKADNVLLLPFQPREKLPEMLAAADVTMVLQKQNVIAFNMPSKIQVLLANGRAIIASVPDQGTAARAIRNSGGGIVTPPEDSETLAKTILDLYHHPEKAAVLGQKGRQYAEQEYCFAIALDRYEALFSSIVPQA